MTLTGSIRQAARDALARASVRQLSAESGVPRSTFHDFVKGAGVRSTTLEALATWTSARGLSAEDGLFL